MRNKEKQGIARRRERKGTWENAKQEKKSVRAYLNADPVLFIAMLAAVLSSCFVPPSRAYLAYLDGRVLCLLFALMVVVGGLQRGGAFGLLIEHLLRLVHNTRTLATVFIGACFFSSMFITNDVALITFVPLTVLMLTQTQKQKLLIPIIVLQTVFANLGSMLTPLGNPQNLYLYALSEMALLEFLKLMALPTLVSFLLLVGFLFCFPKEHIECISLQASEQISQKRILCWMLLFLLCLLAVLRILPYGFVLAVVIAAALLLDRRVLLRVDYGLLLTFVFLFVLIGNIKSIPQVSTALSALLAGRELSVGILLSQVISNVPASMLLSKFTTNYAALLLGVNLGGLGTLLASMASVISYKLYCGTAGAQPAKYLGIFSAVNLLLLGVLWTVVGLFAPV